MKAAQAKRVQGWAAATARPACARCGHAQAEPERSPQLPEAPALRCVLGSFTTQPMAVCAAFACALSGHES